MIEIRSRASGATLLSIPAETLVGRKFRGVRLPQADFANMLLTAN